MIDEQTKRLDAVVAAADLCARAGASQFEVGYEDDDLPARWYCSVLYQGHLLKVGEQPHPSLAADMLAARILRGGRCTNCNRTVTVAEGGVNYKRECRWYREGDAWVQGCNGKRRATKDQ